MMLQAAAKFRESPQIQTKLMIFSFFVLRGRQLYQTQVNISYTVISFEGRDSLVGGLGLESELGRLWPQCERDPTQLFHPVTLQSLESI